MVYSERNGESVSLWDRVSFLERSFIKQRSRLRLSHTSSLMHQAPTADRFICESAFCRGQMKVRSDSTPNKFIFPTSAEQSADAIDARFLSSITERSGFERTIHSNAAILCITMGPGESLSHGVLLVKWALWCCYLQPHAVCMKVSVLFWRNKATRRVTLLSFTVSKTQRMCVNAWQRGLWESQIKHFYSFLSLNKDAAKRGGFVNVFLKWWNNIVFYKRGSDAGV